VSECSECFAGEECYVALDKGPITDQHVLILPIEHYPSTLHLSLGAWEEMERWARMCGEAPPGCQREHPA
jgi:diadenosine tetraphosphate (Ap4A) HIT family hydrolase